MFDDIEGLSPELKAQLEEKVKAQFVAKTDFDAVLSKKDELLGEAKKAKEAARQAAEEAAEAKRQQALKSGDVESIKQSYEEKVALAESRANALQEAFNQKEIQGVAKDFVGKKFVNDPIVAEAITEKFSKRLKMRDGKLVVVDAEGGLSSLSVDDLKEEFLKNGALKAHIISTQASGGGASGGQSGGGGATVKTLKDAKTQQERVAFIKAGLNKQT